MAGNRDDLRLYTSAGGADRFVPVEVELTEIEAFVDDDTVCRFKVDVDGAVWAFSVERRTTVVDAAGVELRDPPEGDEPTYRVLLDGPITSTWLRRLRFEATLNEAKRRANWWQRPARKKAGATSGTETGVTTGREDSVKDGEHSSSWSERVAAMDLEATGDTHAADNAQHVLDALHAQLHHRSGQSHLGPRYYARIAKAYVDLLASESSAPLRQLADELKVTYGTARNHVAEARRLGLLTGRGRGVASGSLTPKTYDLLPDLKVNEDAAYFEVGSDGDLSFPHDDPGVLSDASLEEVDD